MPLLFSYGTLQQESVQLSTFGRRLEGQVDELVGFEQSLLKIEDPEFVATSGKSHHAIVTFNGRPTAVCAAWSSSSRRVSSPAPIGTSPRATSVSPRCSPPAGGPGCTPTRALPRAGPVDVQPPKRDSRRSRCADQLHMHLM